MKKCFSLFRLYVLCFLTQAVFCVDRVYYIAAVEIEWDYVPSGYNSLQDDQTEAIRYIKGGNTRIGHEYNKAVYREYTDETYMTEVPPPPWRGLLGPEVKGETGDNIIIHFKNFATRPYSLHPHGLFYTKEHEGALYEDKTSGDDLHDNKVAPGDSHTYIWKVSPFHAPAPDDSNCIVWAYHSHVDTELDTNSGLIGSILTCKKGTLNADGQRTDVDREYTLLVKIYDEMKSWYTQQNLVRCGSPSKCKDLLQRKDPSFMRSNNMHSINGYMYGHMEGMFACTGESVVWYIMSIGSEMDIHSISVEGQTLNLKDHRVDTVSVFPSSFVTALMKPVNPGTFMIHCRVMDHFTGGMQVHFTVDQCDKPHVPDRTARKIRRYFIQAEEVIWDYAPAGYDMFDRQGLIIPGTPAAVYFTAAKNRIGGQYKKALYFEYTDDTFKKQKKKPDSLGFLGPIIRAEIGEKVEIVFSNNCTRPYSIQPHGVVLDNGGSDKSEWDYYDYIDGKDSDDDGQSVPPGGRFTYQFYIPPSVGPTRKDSDCITFMYVSAVNRARDIMSGLIGPLLLCKQGALNYKGEQGAVDKEYVLMFTISDENRSWYLDDNIKQFCGYSQFVDKREPGFMQSNMMHGINGRMFANLWGLEVCRGGKVAWHVFSVGNNFDVHSVYFHGNTVDYNGNVKDSHAIFPGTSATLLMTPDNLGDWALVCRTNTHYNRGMKTLYHVKDCNYHKPKPAGAKQAKTRRYFIAAIETEWEYAPRKTSIIDGSDLTDPSVKGSIYIRSDDGFIGSRYKKAIFREFTDASFTEMKSRGADDVHLGILGPFIKAQVGDTIEIVFMNKASRPYSLHPHGVFYDKANEGSLYEGDGTNLHMDDAVPPGSFFVYRWQVPKRAGPGRSDPNCVNWVYYSATDSHKDMYSGLVGPLIICRPHILDENGRRKDVDREFALLFSVFNEMYSWYMPENIKKYAPSRENTDFLKDSDFVESNKMHMINGYVYGNNQGLIMKKGEVIAWYIMGIGGSIDIHTVHFHGHTFVKRTGGLHRGDVVEVFPGVTRTVEMITDNPGRWLLHCHVNDHMSGGMETTYDVE